MDKEALYDSYHLDRDSATLQSIRFTHERMNYSLEKAIPAVLKELKSEARVLDIGCGNGRFALFCQGLGLSNYLGVDLSAGQVEIAGKLYAEYEFRQADALEYLKTTGERFDLIHMSHVMEHFPFDEGLEIMRLLKERLNPGAIVINEMPNADAYFNAPSARYIDVTHERLYNPVSFAQLLTTAGFDRFDHFNYYIGSNVLLHALHRVTIRLFEIVLRIMGFDPQPIYTSSMITVIRA